MYYVTLENHKPLIEICVGGFYTTTGIPSPTAQIKDANGISTPSACCDLTAQNPMAKM
jgi:hypothetical protein